MDNMVLALVVGEVHTQYTAKYIQRLDYSLGKEVQNKYQYIELYRLK